MLSHIDKKGNAKIVDISSKSATNRIAVASGKIYVSSVVFNQIKKNINKKGDILNVARIAAIMASKNTSNLIPLCHPLKIEDINIEFLLEETKGYIEIIIKVKCYEKTGVEMEDLTATYIVILTIYDMSKEIDKKMIISDILLIEKKGGKKNTKIN